MGLAAAVMLALRAPARRGAAPRSNDLAGGLERMAKEGSSYYLLGYQPGRAPDGKWHELDVKVARKGAFVRARRGYLAGPPEGDGAARRGDSRAARDQRTSLGTLRSPALVAGGDRAGIPLRMVPHLQGPDGAGSARVLMALELDGDHIAVEKIAAGNRAALELTVLAVARDRPKVLPLVQALDLTLAETQVGGWWALFREVRLPPGVAQIRVTLRDRASGAVGSVSQRVEVPDVDAPYLSTPLLTEKTQPPLARGEPPRLVPSAHRSFRARDTLYCQYEVFGFGGRDMPGVARVLGGYTLQAANGRTIALVPLTPIATDGSRVVRRLAIPLERLEPGTYELTLNVEDQLARRSLSAREPFTVEPEPGPDEASIPGAPR